MAGTDDIRQIAEKSTKSPTNEFLASQGFNRRVLRSLDLWRPSTKPLSDAELQHEIKQLLSQWRASKSPKIDEQEIELTFDIAASNLQFCLEVGTVKSSNEYWLLILY